MIFKTKRMDIELTENEQALVCETAELLEKITVNMEDTGCDTIKGDSDLSIDDIKIFISLLDHLGAEQAVVY